MLSFSRLLAALGLFYTPTAAVAQARPQHSDAAALTRAMAEALVETAPHAGLSIAISRDGRPVFAQGFGFADIERRTPVTTATRFRAASVSKAITATALGRLMQERRIDLDAPIQRYVPTFPEKAQAITARQLAGHISGMPHYSGLDRMERRFYPSVTDALAVFSHVPLVSPPLFRYGYSTHGYTLLSAAIEAAAGKPFLAYLDEAVFTPLGMTSTAPDLRASPHPDLGAFHTLRDGRVTLLAESEDPSYKWAGGGLTSTPSDLLKLANSYLNGFLDSATVAEMWRSQRLSNGNETGVGLGWRRSFDYSGRPVVEHAGSMEGARAVVSILPEQRMAVSVMANREWSSNIEITAHMLALPFVDQRPRGAGITGTAEVTLDIASGQGARRSVVGELALTDGRGTLVIEGVTNRLIHVGAGNVYALVRPIGIYHATLEVVDGTIRGRVLSYGSPQSASPAASPPAITFSGVLR